MKTSSTRWMALAVMLLATQAAISQAATVEEQIDHTYPFAVSDRLELRNTNGSIAVEVWDRQEVRIKALKKVQASSEDAAEAALAELEVEIQQASDGLRIETHHPGKGRSWWSGRGISSSVEYEITVPSRANLDLGTVNGKIRLSGVSGELELSSTNGSIKAANCGGAVSAHTTNGSIDVELRQLASEETMSLRTTNGGITLALPTDSRVTFTARTTNGSIRSDLPVTQRGSSSRTRLDGEINGGGGRIELRTTNGGIRIEAL